MPNLNPVQLAIVSPCSSCKNQLDVASGTRAACPRRQLLKLQASMDDAGQDYTNMAHLFVMGTEGTDQEGDGTLVNPVYWDEGNAIMIWIASLSDNVGASGGILDPGFDTQYIQCHSLPVVPRDPEAVYFQKGAYMEGDHLEVTISASQQMQLDSTDGPEPVLIDGFAQKVNFVFNHPRTPVDKDLVPAGC